jgi:outer membrane immunogenic protein
VKKLLLNSSASFVLVSSIVMAHGAALAAPDDLDREKAQLRKENADLREMLRLREENSALRRRLQQQGSEPPVADARPSPAIAPAPPRHEARAGLTTPKVNPSVFESYAADMPVKAAPVRPEFYNWTGFYVGANLGWSVGHDRVRQTAAFPASGAANTLFLDASVAPQGLIGGLQLGYNWQGGRNWLIGFEADIQASDQKDRACTIACLVQGGDGPITQTQTLAVDHKLDYFGTARGRFGWVADNVLIYGTAGAAFGRVRETARIDFIFPPPNGGAVSLASSVADTRFGWTVGGGVEAALWGNWTAKVEYLYLDLGDTSPRVVNTVLTQGAVSTPITTTTAGTFRDHIVRAGVNYRFGEEAPLRAYASMRGPDGYAGAPIYSWTGFYVGANAGYGSGVSHLSQAGSASGFPVASTADGVVTPKGFAGGFQLGYNWQAGRNWLVGFEADIQGTNQSNTGCLLICFVQTNPTGGGNNAFTANQTIDFFGTVRGRLGVVNNNILFYATAGGAFARVGQTLALNFTRNPDASTVSSASTRSNLTGWTAGGGIEAALWGNWTAKAEYLYLDLGKIKSDFGGLEMALTNTSTVQDHIFRAGVNYRFAGEPRTW